MKFELNYNEYDSLSLALKKEELERMLGYYRAFGWEEYERNDDFRYFDIVHIKLIRQHKIPNKDRLQLLQVKMEASVNRFALVRKRKHSKSLITALTLGVFGAGLVALGLWLAIAFSGIPFIIAGSVISAFGLAIPFCSIPLIKKTVRRENEYFAIKFKEMAADISRILSSAKKLYGGENGKLG